MRILTVIPHYFGPSHPENNLPAIGSYLEPLGRIAALNGLIVALHRHFGPNRYYLSGSAIAADDGPRALDIVILAIRGHELTGELGFAPGTFEVEYVDCKPPYIAFEAQRVLRERLGRYDFYCFTEDDLSIHDPAFFEKLTWFQHSFGLEALLMPVRYEVPATGNPAKVIVDPELDEQWYRPFRRPGQRERLEGSWNGRDQVFRLPTNPHAGSFFLTAQQMAYWAKQPSYGDRDASWTGPIESAGTLSVGRVFDLYKPSHPDPFFLEIEHFGVRYSSQLPFEECRHGEAPLLAIAQHALRAAVADGAAERRLANGTLDPAFASIVRRWLAQGTTVELRGQMDVLETELARHKHAADLLRAQSEAQARDAEALQRRNDALAAQLAGLTQDADQRSGEIAGLTREVQQRGDQVAAVTQDAQHRNAALEAKIGELAGQLAHAHHRQDVHSRSLRWLLGSLRAELRRRLRGG